MAAVDTGRGFDLGQAGFGHEQIDRSATGAEGLAATSEG
jgi:hypothetical protein